MSGATTASTFWAQKSRDVTRSTPPAPADSTPRNPTTVIPGTTDPVVFKGRSLTTKCAASTNRGTGMANGATATSVPKRTDWADSDEDDDFMLSFPTSKDAQITTLEQEATLESLQIEELMASMRTKDVRIEHLERNIENSEQQVAGLQTELNRKDSIVNKLNSDSYTQSLYVQKLVAELDEKSRRIQELEVDVDEKAARIHDLETESDSQTQASTDSDSEKMDLGKHTEPDNTSSSVNIAEPALAPNLETQVIESTIAIIPPQPATTTTSTVTSGRPLRDSPTGPAVNDAKFPKMWSPDTPKIVAPVEKPRVLKMAIDTSKFGKKLIFAAQMSARVVDKGIAASSYGASSKDRAKTDVMPEINVSKDIRQMPHKERMLYANGPDVSVLVGSAKLATLPKYVLMQCSEEAYKHFMKNPDADSINFPVSMDSDAAKAHLQWMLEMTYQGRVYSLALNNDDKFNEKNLKICQAARVMGLSNTYVGHFTKAMCDRIRLNNYSMEFVSQICDLIYTDNDPIFACLANNLVNQHMHRGTVKPNGFDSLLDKYPLLKEKTAKIERRCQNGRAREKGRSGQP
jgi:hypothetical protein